mgnify:CR=1 FL=1
MAVFGFVIFCLILLVIAVGPYLYTQSANAVDFALASQPPSLAHPFGTNTLGQDQLARVMRGGRVSLTVGLTAMAMAVSVGTLIGAIAGFYGGLIGALLMRLTDLFLSLPQLPLSLLII